MVLKDLRVLDFGRYIAGPYCATMLADLGAEVIRVERLQGSEDRYLAPIGEKGEGSMFLHLNRNKLGMTLNPMKPEGRKIVSQLVANADVVIANLPQESLEKMGLDYETLKKYKFDIIVVSTSAFGAKGPYSKRTGFDGIAQAMCGNMHLSGTPGQPTRSFANWVDFSTAMYAAFGVMAALMHKTATGEGQVVETNLLRSSMSLFHANNMEQSLTDKNRTPTGNRGQFGGPSDSFDTQDGKIIISVIGKSLFQRCATLMDAEDLLSDPRFSTDNDRGGQQGEILSEHMQTWCLNYTNQQALALLEQARIPAGPVLSPKQAMEDQHVQQSNMLQMLDYPGIDQPIPMMPLPIEFSALETSIRLRPPQLGEHTEQIMRTLGYNASEIKALRDTRVI
jgi:crotonobetainyl-CoA:carnitine CoA-transferase CaiB-like acyl-CoA transferase